jgi:tetratricopeptide (TPR) repeat protein
MRRHFSTPLRRLAGAAAALAIAAGVTAAAGAFGAAGSGAGSSPGSAGSAAGAGPVAATAPRPADAVERARQRLRLVPGDWRTWARLGVAYLDRGRATGDPTFFPRAEEAVRRSLALRPRDNGEAVVARGALANARHDFAAARADALAAIRADPFDADAYAVLADAETQLGNAAAATAAVQRLLDLRPGLSAYARASYDLEQRGRAAQAAGLMRRALETATDPADIAFCRTQLGDLAWHAGDHPAAGREYAAGLAADPSSVALQRGRARVAAAQGRTDDALADYADLTSRVPVPGYLLEHAELLRSAGRATEAAARIELAGTAHGLFTASGGVDGITGAAIELAAGRPARAVAEARAEWQRRRHAEVADALAWSLHLAGRDAEALGYARRAVATGARNAAYAYHLGAIELALGDRAAARTHLGAALRINPAFSPVDAPAARAALNALGGTR